ETLQDRGFAGVGVGREPLEPEVLGADLGRCGRARLRLRRTLRPFFVDEIVALARVEELGLDLQNDPSDLRGGPGVALDARQDRRILKDPYAVVENQLQEGRRSVAREAGDDLRRSGVVEHDSL